MTIAVDFDGTIVEHCYPAIGPEKPFAIDTLKYLSAKRHKLILWTVREGELLDEAVAYCKSRGLEFYAINRNYPEEDLQKNSYMSRKLKADVWIDDRNVGGLPDWGIIYEMIHGRITFKEIMNRVEERENPDPKKGFISHLFRNLMKPNKSN